MSRVWPGPTITSILARPPVSVREGLDFTRRSARPKSISANNATFEGEFMGGKRGEMGADLHRKEDFENPHVPHTTTIQAPVVPTKGRDGRTNTPRSSPREKGSLVFQDNQEISGFSPRSYGITRPGNGIALILQHSPHR